MFDARPRPSGATAFFTVSLAERGQSVLTDHFDLLTASVALTRRVKPFYADAWVVMPDHLHCVLTLPEGDTDFAGRWRTIRRRFTRRLPRGAVPGPVWRHQVLEHPITDMSEYVDCVRACWFDPVRHALVKRPEDWCFSSIHGEVAVDRSVA